MRDRRRGEGADRKIEEIAERVRPIAERYNIPKVYLFGSYARGEATEGSDVDLLVDADNVHGLAFFGLWADLEDALEKELDIITTNALYNEHKDDKLTSQLKYEIEKDRRLIYDKQR